ncbi:MAG TPA: protein kinase [Candidatus Binatia bacterium]|nr:protein kinase [Candidatus Binatia bacterium]
MQQCQSCGSEVRAETRFCGQCGTPVTPSGAEAPTLAATASAGPANYTPARPRSSRPSSHSSANEGRFVPGMLVAGRYRIIALLGRGGMGEVYRADDLSLGQPVALKFLPQAMTDEVTLERFRNEVRIARRISHPNVCRVYDIGQADNQVFLSMEYIDGEDLSSLLRRIGRLPSDKAIEIGRKICAGLAAAHDKNVLHRDLKPSNIMLDGRGEVLVMDFGLAGIAHEIEDVRSGTPAYMAPEQLAGREVTARSDIYSLGLVLYELFTGRPAYDGRTREEIVRARRTNTPHRPSTLVRDLDPAVERAILRCLEVEPENRPPSALMVAAALPGGDPLAAALAAGETPSPQVVAAAGETSGMPVRTAVMATAAALIGLALFCVVAARTSAISRMNLPYSSEVLSQRARDIVQQLGYTTQRQDAVSGMDYDSEYIEHLDHAGGEHPNWDRVLATRPSLLTFWRRQSPDDLVATRFESNLLTPGIVDLDDPPPTLSGMVAVSLDPQGRLTRFTAMPPQQDSTPANAQPYDWKQLFSLAGLDMAQFQATQPIWNSLSASDQRAAWTGVWPGTSTPLRVEAAAWHGQPVYFQLIGEWTKPDRMPSTGASRSRTPEVLLVIFVLLLVAGAVWLARRNYLLQRSDLQGALRLALLIFVLEMLVWLFTAHFVPSLGSILLFVLAASGAVFLSVLFYIVYLAIEPYVRRQWPHAIISWSRLMAGRIRDPLVGRDTLFGVILGVSWSLIFGLLYLGLKDIGATPNLGSSDFLLGPRHVIGTCLTHAAQSVQGTMYFFFLMFAFRVIFRKPWLAAIAFVAFWSAIKTWDEHHLLLVLPAVVAVYSIAAFVVLRFGFIALAVGIFTVDLISNIPLTTDLSSFYIGAPAFVLFLIALLALWGGYTALAGQKLLTEKLFE